MVGEDTDQGGKQYSFAAVASFDQRHLSFNGIVGDNTNSGFETIQKAQLVMRFFNGRCLRRPLHPTTGREPHGLLAAIVPKPQTFFLIGIVK